MGYSPLVSAAYDFTRSGAGEYYIEPSDVFIYVDADGTPQQFHAIVRDAVYAVPFVQKLIIAKKAHFAPVFRKFSDDCRQWRSLSQPLTPMYGSVRKVTYKLA